MEEKKTKIEGRLLLLAVLFALFQAVGVIFTTVAAGYDLSRILESALMAVMSFVLYFAYRSHTKNVMKPLLGAVLMLLLVHALSWGGYYLQNLGAVAQLYTTNYAFAVFAVFRILTLLVLVWINLLHYSINASHHSSPAKVKLNRGLFAVFAVLLLAESVCFAVMDATAAGTVGDCCSGFSEVFLLGMVICIEHTMDEFRIAREEKAEAELEK